MQRPELPPHWRITRYDDVEQWLAVDDEHPGDDPASIRVAGPMPTREGIIEAVWREPQDPWVEWADHETDRANRAEAEVSRLRARVRVEAEDVERAVVTRAHVEAWLLANGWGPDLRDDGFDYCLWRLPGKPRAPVVVFDQLSPAWAADVVRVIAIHVERPGLDILDEMAAMEVPS